MNYEFKWNPDNGSFKVYWEGKYVGSVKLDIVDLTGQWTARNPEGMVVTTQATRAKAAIELTA